MTGGVRFGVLGSVSAWNGRTELDLGTPRQRAVLAMLLLSEGRQVSMEGLINAQWGPDAPRSAVTTTRSYVSRLRQVLADQDENGDGCGAEIRAAGGGYQLIVDPDAVDLAVFRHTTAAARSARGRGDLPQASQLLRAALALWRGPALGALDGPFFDSRRSWLEELRGTALQARWELDIELGNCEEAITELTQATTTKPYHERLWELLMLALDRNGRRAEALSAYQRITRLLDHDLGLDPGAGLQKARARMTDTGAAVTRTGPDRRRAVA
jgi:DNA-binding SARP family transcriptional activator